MRQFNTPPGWPDPPNARWRPPKRWGPAESWPPAPAGWRFWVDENGRPVRGPIGRYGGPSIVKPGTGAAVVLVLLGLVLFNPFSGDDSAPAAAPTTTIDSAPPPEGTPTAPETEAARTSPTTTPTDESTWEPTPTPPPSSKPTEPESSTPQPSSTPKPTSAPTSAPTTTSVTVVYQNCAEVRAAGKAPLHRGDAGYSEALDKNGDGTACDRGNS